MKSGLCAGGLNIEGIISSGRVAMHEVRESGEVGINCAWSCDVPLIIVTVTTRANVPYTWQLILQTSIF
jgi:hypothetical protein